MLSLGVLVSGTGTNLQAILDACAAGSVDAQVKVVISNVPDAKALERATAAKVPTFVLEHRRFASRERFEDELILTLRANRVELVCLAGFMRLLTPHFLAAFPMKVINIHPALLPAFPGIHAVRQAIEYGSRISGCTVHFVDEGTDSGPVIVQAAVPVLESDTENSLAARIQAQEHRIYPQAINLIARGKVRIQGRRVLVDPVETSDSIVNPPAS
jgi:phosphoribosylglycinamide formyltransferase 1